MILEASFDKVSYSISRIQGPRFLSARAETMMSFRSFLICRTVIVQCAFGRDFLFVAVCGWLLAKAAFVACSKSSISFSIQSGASGGGQSDFLCM